MRNLSISVFIAFCMHIILAAQQPELNRLDENGKKTGYWRVLYEKGNTRYEGVFLNDFPVGEFKRYYPGGILQALMHFSENGKTSFAKLYYENGKLAAKGKYVNRRKDSIWNYYAESDGHLTLQENYSSDRRYGNSTKFYRNNQISEVIRFENDERNGIWEQYFENGVKRLKSSHSNDKREGLFETWNHEGVPSVKGYYKDGVMDGEWTYYNDEGEIEIIAEYNNGILLPNEEIERRQEEFSRRIEESIGNYDQPELIPF